MSRIHTPLPIIAALALAAAPAVVAKEIKEAQMCGADGCTTVDDGGDREILVNGGPPRRRCRRRWSRWSRSSPRAIGRSRRPA